MLLVEMFVVNCGPVRRRLLMEKHAYGRLGDRTPCPSPSLDPPLLKYC